MNCFDPRQHRSFAQPLAQLFQRRAGSLGAYFNLTIRQVADITLQTNGAGRTVSGIPKPNPLHPS